MKKNLNSLLSIPDAVAVEQTARAIIDSNKGLADACIGNIINGINHTNIPNPIAFRQNLISLSFFINGQAYVCLNPFYLIFYYFWYEPV
jgi:hypothetical protein